MLEFTNSYYFYIVTNESRTTFAMGVAGSLRVRLRQLSIQTHAIDALGGELECLYLLYWEQFEEVKKALKRERSVRKWSQKKLASFISRHNEDWHFLNEEILV